MYSLVFLIQDNLRKSAQSADTTSIENCPQISQKDADNVTIVNYATTGMDNSLFVAKYLTQLPSENTIRDFLSGGREQIILELNEERAKYTHTDRSPRDHRFSGMGG